MRKYKAGDLVTVRLDEARATAINNGLWIHHTEITHHEPAPFNWDGVKPGMGFDFRHKTYWYVGPDLSGGPYVLLTDDVKHHSGDKNRMVEKSALTRAPEHDIEVSP